MGFTPYLKSTFPIHRPNKIGIRGFDLQRLRFSHLSPQALSTTTIKLKVNFNLPS